MSLRVWLPFTDGTLRQQGLSNETATSGGTINLTNTGKLGKCATFGSAAGGITIPASTMTSFTNCSVAFWLKINGWGSSYDTYFQAGTGSTPWNNYIFGFLRNNTNSTICFTISNGSSASNTNYLTSALSINTWYHIVLTYETGKCKIYLNGVLDHEYSTTIVPAFDKITKITLGRCNNDSSYQTQCSINDFRVYDHCLSPMEVKELAKGLVLHYPLNRQGWGQENLVTGSNTNSLSTNNWAIDSQTGGNTRTIEQDETDTYCVKFVRDSTVQSGWYYLSYGNLLRNQIKTDTTYTLTFDCKASVNSSITFSGLLNVNATNYMTNATTNIQSSVVANQWCHMKYQCKTISSFDGITIGSQAVYLAPQAALKAVGVTVYFKNIKLEEGEIATPWCPNSSDTLATTMGLNSTTEYDCSGFCNNGTKVGTLGWSSNTPKYNVSLDVTTDSCARYIYGPAQTQLTDQITLACWLYQTSATATNGGNSTTKQFALSQGRDYLNLGFNITVNNGKPGVYAGNGGSESGARVSLISTTKTIIGSWHHVAATYNNGALKLYVDGQLDRETTIGALDYVDAPALVIGKMAYGYTGATSYFPFVGYISDARVYATALSASDVKSLYQNSAYIDSSGNVYGAVHSEV